MANPPNLDALRALAEKVETAERTLDDARRERDEAIRDVRKATTHTVDEIAEAARVSPSTVKTVIRGIR
ncbi:hypothetical protein [Frankia sp. BMG5.23]|uniref:hypothetical protein n=1 Tax=Frankia sp. BMG5.23 TaxID=683305 RepID=UPI0005B838C0|nr:hypothetical protein [Frankia sp. BMG5.23]